MISIQPLGQRHRRHACGIVAKNSPNNFGLDRDDFAITCRRRLAWTCYSPNLIAIAKTAARLPELDAPSEAASSLIREVLQEQRVHRAFQADVEMRDVAFGERDDVDTSECQTLEESCRVFLIATESIQRFGEDDIESPLESIPHQRLESRTQEGRTRHGVVSELVSHRPPLARSMFAADPQLVSDRGFTLVV